VKTLRACVIAVLGAVAVTTAAAAGYSMLKTITITGTENRWDYCTVDAAGRRVYLTYGNSVEVLDADSLAPVGKIDNTQGAHGVAIAQDLGRGFVSDGAAATMTIFDLKTLATIAQVKTTGDNPDSIVYDPATQRVFTFNGASSNSTVFDAKDGKVLATFDLGGKPEFSASDGKGHVFVDLPDKNTVLQIDSQKMAPGARWSTAPSCTDPSTMAVDREAGRLFVGCRGVMAMLDISSGKIVSTAPIGKGVDAITFDTAAHLVFSANGSDSTMTVVKQESPDKLSVVETVPTAWGARTMTVDSKTHRVFLPTSDFDRTPQTTPPAPGAPRRTPYGVVIPGTFRVLVLGS
jgi:DNA-binding beta-propeller fold protein YncE